MFEARPLVAATTVLVGLAGIAGFAQSATGEPAVGVSGAAFVASDAAAAQPGDEEALRIIERAVIALADAASLSMKATHGAEGGIESMFPLAEGTVRALRLAPDSDAESADTSAVAPMMLRVKGEGAMRKGAESIAFDVVRKDNQFFWLDHEDKYLRIRPVMSRNLRDAGVRLVKDLAPDMVFGEEPFKNLLESEGLELAGRETINGEECVGVSAPVGKGGSRVQTVHFAVSDGLPRRMTMAFDTNVMSGSIVTTYSDVQVGVAMAESVFELDAPDGYRSERASAEPVRTPIPPVTGIPGRQGDTDDELQGPSGPPEPAVEKANDFSLKTPAGETVTLEGLRGNVVVLDFWGTWCLPCLKAAPELQQFHEDYADLPVEVYGINFRERDPQRAIDKMTEMNLDYGLLLEGDAVAREYRIRQFPSYIIIGFDGEILRRVTGHEEGATFDSIRATVDEYLRAKGVSLNRGED